MLFLSLPRGRQTSIRVLGAIFLGYLFEIKGKFVLPRMILRILFSWGGKDASRLKWNESPYFRFGGEPACH